MDPAELQSSVRWERLYYPVGDGWQPLGVGAATPFSRYILAEGWKRPRSVDDRALRVLAIIASPVGSPADTGGYDLDPISSVERQALHDTLDQAFPGRVTYLETGTTAAPTIAEIRRALARGYDFVHFLCHGAVTPGGTVLFLENNGVVGPIPDNQITSSFTGVEDAPLLCFLSACETATQGRYDGFVSLGPTLVKFGSIPAVVAMSDKVGMETAQLFTSQFYSQLMQHGSVDLAVNEARYLVQDKWDWSVPVLFSRLPDNQLLDITPTTTGQGEDILSRKAASCYQDAEEAVRQGNWAQAITGYEGALMLVPNYRDAPQKLANAQLRQRCTILYDQAHQQVSIGDYSGLLQTVQQITTLNPNWESLASMRLVAECGQMYQQAITSLKAGDVDHGVALLVDVVRKKPDFLDAASRLDNLTHGGDGLTDMPAPLLTKGTITPMQRSKTEAAIPNLHLNTTREYEWQPANQNQLADTLKQWFKDNGYEAQVLQQAASTVVQGKKGDLFHDIAGLSTAATVALSPTNKGLSISIGGSGWLDKGVVAVAGLFTTSFTFGLPLITAAFGAGQQKILENNLWQIVDSYIVSRGGKQAQ